MDPDLPRLPESGATSGAAVHVMVDFVRDSVATRSSPPSPVVRGVALDSRRGSVRQHLLFVERCHVSVNGGQRR